MGDEAISMGLDDEGREVYVVRRTHVASEADLPEIVGLHLGLVRKGMMNHRAWAWTRFAVIALLLAWVGWQLSSLRHDVEMIRVFQGGVKAQGDQDG